MEIICQYTIQRSVFNIIRFENVTNPEEVVASEEEELFAGSFWSATATACDWASSILSEVTSRIL